MDGNAAPTHIQAIHVTRGDGHRSLHGPFKKRSARPTWGFAGWQVLGSNQRRPSRRFYIPEEAGRGQVAWCVRFCGVSGAGLGMPGEGPGSRWSAPAGRTTLRPVLLPAHAGKARERYELVGWRGPVRSWLSWRAGSRLRSSLRGARGWRPRGHGADARAGSGINQTGGQATRGWGPVKPAITRCPRPGLLTRPSASWWPGRGPGRRASRRRPR